MTWRASHPAFRQQVAVLEELFRRAEREPIPSDIAAWLQRSHEVLGDSRLDYFLDDLEAVCARVPPAQARTLRASADGTARTLADLVERAGRAFERGIGWLDPGIAEGLRRLAERCRALGALREKHWTTWRARV